MPSVLWPLCTSIGVTVCVWICDRKLLPNDYTSRRFTSLVLLAIAILNIAVLHDWRASPFNLRSEILPLIRVVEWLLIPFSMGLGAVAGIGAIIELYAHAKHYRWIWSVLPLVALCAYAAALDEFISAVQRFALVVLY